MVLSSQEINCRKLKKMEFSEEETSRKELKLPDQSEDGENTVEEVLDEFEVES